MKRFAVFLLLVLLTPLLFAKDFSIPSATIEYSISDDGTVHVVETINYHLYDCTKEPFKELYIQKPPELEISNAQGHCIGATCTFRVDEPATSETHDRELILALVSKKCGDITAVFEYDVKAIMKYKDTAQFYYKVWGDKWAKPTSLTVKINLPGNVKETKSYLHYEYYTDKPPVLVQSGQQITISAPDQHSGRFLEINMLMPLSWFNEQGNYYYNNKYTKAQIVEIEEKTMKELEEKRRLESYVPYVILLIAILPLIALPILYYIFGKELSPEQAGYVWTYEREPPSDHGPAECIYFLNMKKEVGDPQDIAKAMSATMMSLVNKGAMNVSETKKKGLFGTETDLIFTFKEPKVQLRDYEQALYDYMRNVFISTGFGIGEVLRTIIIKSPSVIDVNAKQTEQSGTVEASKPLSLLDFKNKVANTISFQSFSIIWMKMAMGHIDEKQYADIKGNHAASIVAAIHFIAMVLAACATSEIGISWVFCFLGIIIDIAIFSLIGSKMAFFGRWTKEGRVLNLKWTNFKKYLADFTMLEEHPPESVKMWDHLMTYAIALGIADKTIKAMKKIAPTWVERSSMSSIYVSSAAFSALSYGMAPTYSSSGSGGGFGGGSGGGGGGGGGGAR